MDTNLLSIIIPVYNEKHTIGMIIERIESMVMSLKKEVIIVDDHSTDGTYERLEKIASQNEGIKLFRHEKNLGKGACIRSGFAHASGDIAIIQDADLEYDPHDIPKVIRPIMEGHADVVYGSRFTGYPRRALYYWHSVGNRFLTFVSNALSNLNLTDMETGCKAFKRIVYKNIKLVSNDFAVEPEITAKVARMRQRIYEVPISYKGRSYYEGKKINWVDGIKALYATAKHSTFSKISDDIGFQTLEILSASESYNRYIFSMLKPFIGERILEIGSGIGNITKYMLDKNFVLATDVSASYLHILQNTFENSPNVKVAKLAADNFEPAKILQLKVDTIICLNVLEHIQEDSKVIKNVYESLNPGGRLILIVPACPWAYTGMDKNLGHHRRYNKFALEALALSGNFRIEKINYFNMIGVVGWYLSGKLFRRKAVSKGQMKCFNLLSPILRAERLISPPFGLSLIAVLVKE